MNRLSVTAQSVGRGNRYRNIPTLVQQELMPGASRGSIFIETNDKKFPLLVVPVSGSSCRNVGLIRSSLSPESGRGADTIL